MKTLHVEWKHLEKDGKTCERCARTGATVRRVIDDLTAELAARDIRVSFTETLLSEREIPLSNSLLLNDMPIEDLLPGVQVVENHCASCTALCSQDTACRALHIGGIIYEAIPEFMIRQAALRAAGVHAVLPVQTVPAEPCCSCCE